jgi:leishmanolysin
MARVTMTTSIVACAALLSLLGTSAAVMAHRHECIHDSPQLRQILTTDLARGPVILSEKEHRKGRGNFQAQAAAVMRIVVSTQDLVTSGQYCARVGEVVPNKQGASVTCTSDDILTDAKKSILLNNILPAAIAKLSSALLVEPVTRAITVPSDACTWFTIPASHATTGVANADYVLYVGAAPTSGSTLAWAGGCSSDSSGRIVVGRANFGPKYISWATEADQSETVATAVHELMHALGFSETSFAGNIATRTLRGKTAKVLTYPLATSTFKTYLGCDSSAVDGIELEDEGSAGSAGSHFERRVLKEELMTAAGGDKMSALSLAVLQASGHYTADFSKAEGMTWGSKAGCGFVTAKCNTALGGRDAYWCFVESVEACTADFKAAGACAVSRYDSDLPSYFQYFSDPTLGGPAFFDGCPYVQGYSNLVCTDTKTPTDNERVYGHYFGTSGRCFKTTGLVASGYVTPSTKSRCLESRCTDGLVQLRVNGGRWETCTAANQQMSGFTGYNNAVVCPDATTFCASFAAAAVLNPDAPATPSPPTTTGAPGSTTTADPATLAPAADTTGRTKTYVTKGTLKFNGASWREVLATVSADVEEAVRLSLSLLLNMGTSGITISRMSIGSLVVEYNIEGLYRAEELQDRFQAAITLRTSTEWLRPLATRYQASNGTDDVYLLSNEIDTSSKICQWTELGDGTCFVVFVGAAVCLLLLVLFIVWCCCCRKTPEVEDAKIRARREGRASPTEPYGAKFPNGSNNKRGAAQV